METSQTSETSTRCTGLRCTGLRLNADFNANEPAVEVRTEGLDVDGLEVDGLPRVSVSHAEQPNQIQDSLE